MYKVFKFDKDRIMFCKNFRLIQKYVLFDFIKCIFKYLTEGFGRNKFIKSISIFKSMFYYHSFFVYSFMCRNPLLQKFNMA